MGTNPIAGFFKTLWHLVTMQVRFLKEDKNKYLVMRDGKRFRIFRHVRIINENDARAIFIVRFRLKNMSIQDNERFSMLPMLIFMGFKGFCSKYWAVDDQNGVFQGLYEWKTLDDAKNYSRSVAMRFMTNRSEEGSVSFEILKKAEVRDLYKIEL